MKKILLPLTICVLFIISCKKENNAIKNGNFFDSGYRIGTWVNSNKGFVLKFIGASKLIINKVGREEVFTYKIENEKLLMSLPNGTYETSHKVLGAVDNKVTLGNMYITVGFQDGSETFIKQ